MLRESLRAGACLLVISSLAACGGGGGGGSATSDSANASPNNTASSSVASAAAASSASSDSSGASSSSSSVAIVVAAGGTCPSITLSDVDAQTLTGTSTPLQNVSGSYTYGVRNYLAPAVINGLHDPSNYQAAPVLPTWQFATSDPTGGVLTNLECDVAPDTGWHSYKRASGTSSTITHSKVVVTGGRNATANHIYTVYNGQQLVAALADAGLAPKIVRVVGHIDLRWSSNNTVFKEYTSYMDQKFGGSINIPSNTTLVGINDAAGNPARITGTTILIGGELPLTATGDPQVDFENWISAGKDGDNYPTWTRNVILRNIKLDTPWDVNPEDSGNAYADGMTISRAQNIWIDHMTITDGDTPDSLASDTRHDGAMDIVRGSDYVTVSNSFFGDHHKTTLVGNGDSGRAWSDQGRLHVTFTGLWWKGLGSRHPLVRFGQLHTFNNLMEGTTTTLTYGQKFESGLDVRYGSSVLSEGIFHLFTGLKPKEVCGKLAGGTDGIGYRVKDAQFISDKDDNGKTWATTYSGPLDITNALSAAGCTSGGFPSADIAWTPPYSYTLLDANASRANIEQYTGAGRIGKFATTGTARTISGGVVSSSSSSAASSTASSSAASSTASSAASSAAASSASALPAGVLSSWSDNFDSATTSSLLTSSYAALPSNASLPMYINNSGTVSVASGVLTLTGARFSIGALSSTATTSSTTPGGVFNIVGKSCTLTLNLAAAGSGTGNFIVLVDNNTTSSSASPHGALSKVYTAAASTLAAGTNTISWTLTDAAYTAGSFLTLRTESSTTVQINTLSLTCN